MILPEIPKNPPKPSPSMLPELAEVMKDGTYCFTVDIPPTPPTNIQILNAFNAHHEQDHNPNKPGTESLGSPRPDQAKLGPATPIGSSTRRSLPTKNKEATGDSESRYLTPRAVADELGISERLVRQMLSDKRMPGLLISAGKRKRLWRVSRPALERWIKKNSH